MRTKAVLCLWDESDLVRVTQLADTAYTDILHSTDILSLPTT